MSKDLKPFSHLEALPKELITKILSEVTKVDREDVTCCFMTSSALAKSVDDRMVFENMKLHNFVRTPFLAANNNTELMAKCIEHSNPSAHYVKGVLEYFRNNQSTQGLVYLFMLQQTRSVKSFTSRRLSICNWGSLKLENITLICSVRRKTLPRLMIAGEKQAGLAWNLDSYKATIYGFTSANGATIRV